MRLNIRVIPKAKQNKITAQADGSLRIHTTTTPTDGKANEAVLRLLADYLKVPKTTIKIVKGTSARDKVIEY